MPRSCALGRAPFVFGDFDLVAAYLAAVVARLAIVTGNGKVGVWSLIDRSIESPLSSGWPAFTLAWLSCPLEKVNGIVPP